MAGVPLRQERSTPTGNSSEIPSTAPIPQADPAALASDAVWGGVGAEAGVLAARELAKGVQTLGKVAGKLSSASIDSVDTALALQVLGVMNEETPLIYFERIEGNPAWRGILTHGAEGKLMGQNTGIYAEALFMEPDRFIKGMRVVAPHLLNPAQPYERLFLFACNSANGSPASTAQTLANILQKQVVGYSWITEGLLSARLGGGIQSSSALENKGGISSVFPNTEPSALHIF
ncbi:uncharacterized protein ATNIH1004_005413 [Aspergillus tanneri]|uniref:Uncharacterized protein n=1 Tax=Aspergillus tanneri TaxID=1220188 RepID=A0A5M9MID8_9EURO|nr:uncharacterized protein ATNIH1004_005413 [Aspergillus tanneri]KAA8646738.1 hypothetical protein ATNIH1004_005413 [Aspergillus tanneri]